MVPKKGYNSPSIETSFGLNGQAWNIQRLNVYDIFVKEYRQDGLSCDNIYERKI